MQRGKGITTLGLLATGAPSGIMDAPGNVGGVWLLAGPRRLWGRDHASGSCGAHSWSLSRETCPIFPGKTDSGSGFHGHVDALIPGSTTIPSHDDSATPRLRSRGHGCRIGLGCIHMDRAFTGCYGGDSRREQCKIYWKPKYGFACRRFSADYTSRECQEGEPGGIVLGY